MEFRDLKQQYKVLKSDIDAAMQRVAEGSHYIMGPEVRDLEAELAEYVGVRHCVTCANGTDALSLALKVWGIGPGDAVFVPDFTFFSSAEVIAAEGATPVFVDVRDDSFNMDPESLERAIAKVENEGKLKPRVIIAVDLFGLPADFKAIKSIAKAHDLLILEDGAQGFGGSIDGKMACSFGDIATTSFFPAKPLGCYGDGGAMFMDNDEWATLADSYRVHGKGAFKYDNVRIGMNSRLDTLQAAILQVKFKAFREYELDDVNKAAALYTERLAGIVKTPVVAEGFRSSWAQYTIQLGSREQRDSIQAALKSEGIPTMVYYPKPMSGQTVFAEMGCSGCCPVADRLCATVLSLPIHPYITEEQIDTVYNAIKKCL